MPPHCWYSCATLVEVALADVAVVDLVRLVESVVWVVEVVDVDAEDEPPTTSTKVTTE